MTSDVPGSADDCDARADMDASASILVDTAPAVDEAHLQALAEAVGCIVWTVRPDSFGEWSAWRTFTGQAEGAASDWGWLDVVHPDDRAYARQVWSDALASGTPVSLLIRLRRAGGDYRQMRVVGAPVHGDGASAREWVGVCLDVTEQADIASDQQRLLGQERRARAESQAVEARLSAVLDVLPHGVIIANTDGTLVMMNKALQALWGEGAPLDVGIEGYRQYRAWWPTTGQPVAPEEWGMSRALQRREIVVDEELDIETFDGQRKTILNSAAPVYDANGAFIGGVAVNVDITERKRLDAELARRLSELESIFGAITDALFVYDATGQLVRMNAAARSLLGIDPSYQPDADPDASRLETRAHRFNLRNGEGAPLVEDQWVLRRILRGEAIPPEGAVDVLLSRFDGSDARVSFTGAPIFDSAGKIVGAVSVGRDVTERRRVDDELRAANTELAAASAALTRQATNLETMNRRMDQFLGMANHEMKTPLTSLSANLQLAARRLRRLTRIREHGAAAQTQSAAATEPAQASHEAEAVIAMIERAQGAARRMTRLVNELLDVSRIQTGRLEVHPGLCDLVELARGVIAEARQGRSGRVIRLDAEAQSIPVLADADRLSEVIDNYLSNAVKYSPADTPITMSLVKESEQVARLSVRDEGQGISPETQARIWNVFERLDSDSDAPRTDGVNLGLGLHICKIIIELHSGQVGVESAVGEGSTFWFTIPLAPASPTA